jgi:hypothetical protein
LDLPRGQLAAGIEMDAQAFGTRRDFLLSDFAMRPGALTLALPSGRGVLWSRAGRTATQIGPVVALETADALALIATALDRIHGPLLLDVPDRETEIAALLTARGFAVERPFTRMAFGVASATGLGPGMCAIAGPELG